MSVIEFLRVLRERWIVIVACLLLGIVGAVAATALTPKTYESRISLFIAARLVSDDPSAVYQGTLLSQQRVASYAQLITSDRVLQQTITTLGLDESTDELAGQITPSVQTDSVIITIAVTAASGESAARIADGLASVVVSTIGDLESNDANQPAPVTARVMSPAVAPTQASSPVLRTNLLVGAVAGLLVGLGGAFFRNSLDRSVKSPEALEALVGAPVLGSVAFEPSQARHPLTVHERPGARRSEAYRQLRTSLRFIRVDDTPRVILVTSAVAGEGKTTTVSNLAIAVAESGKRVLAIEADLRKPRLADEFGLERATGLTTVLADGLDAATVVQKWWGGSFDVLASGPIPPNPSELLSSQRMEALLAWAKERYDLVLLDMPPLLPVTDAAAVAPFADGVLMVVRHGRTRTEQVAAAADLLRRVSGTLLGTVVTMAPNRTKPSPYYGSFPVDEEPGTAAPAGPPAPSDGPRGNGTGPDDPARGESAASTPVQNGTGQPGTGQPSAGQPTPGQNGAGQTAGQNGAGQNGAGQNGGTGQKPRPGQKARGGQRGRTGQKGGATRIPGDAGNRRS